MAEEIQEAVQIIRVAYDGIDIAMKVGSGGIAAMKKALEFLRGMLDYEKSIGKTSMRKLLMKGGDLQIFQFKTEDMEKVKKLAKKYGILYSALPDVNKKDGMSEIIFHSEAVPRVNMIIQKLKEGRIATFEDYLKDGDEKQLDKLMRFLEGQKKGNVVLHTEDATRANVAMDGLIEKVGQFAMEKKNVSVDSVKKTFQIEDSQAEDVLKRLENLGVLDKRDASGNHRVLMDEAAFQSRMQGYRRLAERIRAVSMSKDLNLADVTISKTLITGESEHAVKTRVPGTWGKDVRYVWLQKENLVEIHGGKTFLTFLNKEKEYKLYDAENRVVETKKGDVLYSNHYDRVEAAVRERYEREAKRRKEINRARNTNRPAERKR